MTASVRIPKAPRRKRPRTERREYPILLDIVPLAITYEAQRRREVRAAREVQIDRRDRGLAGGVPQGEQPIMFLGVPMPTALDAEMSKRMHNVLRRWIGRRFARRGWLRTGDYLIETNEIQDFWTPARRTFLIRTPYLVVDEPLRKVVGDVLAYMAPPRARSLTIEVPVGRKPAA